MRIAYIALYQGPDLLKHRPSMLNLSLGCKVKAELIAETLRKNSHEVEIFSPGPIDQFQFKFYPALVESGRFHPDIPIYYSSALPVKFLTGLWEGWSAKKLLQTRHNVAPFDLVIIQTLKRAQLACADHALDRLGLPVIFEYEDDHFLDLHGKTTGGFLSKMHRKKYAAMLERVSGCMAVSPHLLSQLPAGIPKLLLRGVVGEAIVKAGRQPDSERKNRVVFSGTHEGSQGLEQMVQAWQTLSLPDWELHIAGKGPLTASLQKLAENNRSIVFHGFLSREENARLLCSARIGMNPQDVTRIPGTSFAFKIIEYLAAGLHVITTPRGILEPELESGVTYIADNTSETIASSLKKVIGEHLVGNTAAGATLKVYGPEAMTQALNRLLEQVMERSQRRTMRTTRAGEPAASNR